MVSHCHQRGSTLVTVGDALECDGPGAADCQKVARSLTVQRGLRGVH